MDGAVSYVLTDHLGSASVGLDASGAITAEQRYLPFGEARLTAAFPTDRLFTGQRDVGLGGLMHFGARFYSGTLGRFLSADPLVPGWTDPQSLNRYAFVLNNPLRYIDPSGLTSACGFSYSDPECAEAGIAPVRTSATGSGNVRSALVSTSGDYCTRMPWECQPEPPSAVAPLLGMSLTGYYYGESNAVEGVHPGIDVGGRVDYIVAPASGRIFFYERATGFGNHAVLLVPDNQGGTYQLILAHMQGHNTFGLTNGGWVSAGSFIGVVGSTGFSSGKHLHYEVRHDPDMQVSLAGYGSSNPGLTGRAFYYPSPETLRSRLFVNPWLFSHIRIYQRPPSPETFLDRSRR